MDWTAIVVGAALLLAGAIGLLPGVFRARYRDWSEDPDYSFRVSWLLHTLSTVAFLYLCIGFIAVGFGIHDVLNSRILVYLIVGALAAAVVEIIVSEISDHFWPQEANNSASKSLEPRFKRSAHLYTLIAFCWLPFCMLGYFFFSQYMNYHTGSHDLIIALVIWGLQAIFAAKAAYYWQKEKPT